MRHRNIEQRARLSLHVGLLCLLALAILPASAEAGDRTALVIANSDYGEHQLPQAQAGGVAVADALRAVGFQVTTEENVSGKELKPVIESFVH